MFSVCADSGRALQVEIPMSHYSPLLDGSQKAFLSCYLDTLGLLERMHRLLLDVIKDDFERLGVWKSTRSRRCFSSTSATTR
jgi:hypothetical protein